METLSFKLLKTEFSGPQRAKADSYLNSPLYYLITGRKGAWLYKNNDSALIVCVHPHIEDRLLVFPEVGKADYKLTSSVLNMLTPPQNGVQLARYNDKELFKLKQQLTLSKNSTIANIRHTNEETLDWSYPIHILDTKRVSNMSGPEFAQIRTKHRKAAQKVTSTPLDQEKGLRHMRAALKFWEGNMIANEKDTDDMSDFYNELFKIIEKHPETIDGLFFTQGRKPVGFSVWDVSSKDTANSLVCLGDTTITGLADYQMITACQTLNERGIRYLNTGGSELKSLDAYKAKFQPASSFKIHSIDVIYQKQIDEQVQMHTLVATSSLQASLKHAHSNNIHF